LLSNATLSREIELSLWKYYFEDGSKDDVITALSNYQNEDGGFGHALEPDNWNANSTPYTTLHALNILADIEFTDLSHPIYQGIYNYLHSEKELMEYGWRFSVPSNDSFPHAPWWSFNEEANLSESIKDILLIISPPVLSIQSEVHVAQLVLLCLRILGPIQVNILY